MNFNKSNVYSSARRSFQRSLGLKSAVCGLRYTQKGFTLIELLVSMAILMIIVLMLANLFQQSTRAWEAGMRQTETGLEARAEIHMIQQALSQAIYDRTNETWSVLDENGSLQEIEPWDGTSFNKPTLVPGGYDNLFELEWTSPGTAFSISSVRVYAEKEMRDGEIVIVADTDRGD